MEMSLRSGPPDMTIVKLLRTIEVGAEDGEALTTKPTNAPFHTISEKSWWNEPYVEFHTALISCSLM